MKYSLIIYYAKGLLKCSSPFRNIVTRFGGVLLEKDYPYQNSQHKCTAPKPPPYLVKVTGFKRVNNDEEEMAKAVYHYGPLSAGNNNITKDVSLHKLSVCNKSEKVNFWTVIFKNLFTKII